MSYKASYEHVKMRQVTASQQYPTGLHYVVIVFDSNNDLTVWVTIDLDEWKANIRALHEECSDFVFYKVEKRGSLSVQTIISIE